MTKTLLSTIVLTHIPTNKVRRLSSEEFIKILPVLNPTDYMYEVV